MGRLSGVNFVRYEVNFVLVYCLARLFKVLTEERLKLMLISVCLCVSLPIFIYG
jgi:hypothetical protein